MKRRTARCAGRQQEKQFYRGNVPGVFQLADQLIRRLSDEQYRTALVAKRDFLLPLLNLFRKLMTLGTKQLRVQPIL